MLELSDKDKDHKITMLCIFKEIKEEIKNFTKKSGVTKIGKAGLKKNQQHRISKIIKKIKTRKL